MHQDPGWLVYCILESSDSDKRKSKKGVRRVDSMLTDQTLPVSTLVPKRCCLNPIARKDSTAVTAKAWGHKLS